MTEIQECLSTLQLTTSELPSPKLSFTQVALVEVLTCFHSHFYINMVGSKFLLLVIKVLNCYESQILGVLGHKTQSGEKEITSNSQMVNVTVDDILLTLQDIEFVIAWIEAHLIPIAQEKILGWCVSSDFMIILGSLLSDPTASNPVKVCLTSQITRLRRLSPILWSRMASIITSECRNHLKV